MEKGKLFYVAPSTVHISVALEESLCVANSLVIKEDVSKNADVTISEQAKGADGEEFEIDAF